MPETKQNLRFQDALAIQQGACNPRGIARSLVEAIDESMEEKFTSNDPAVRLILHQLLFIVTGTDLYCHLPSISYHDDTEACRQQSDLQER